MSVFVLIHGAWHGAWCWKKVIPKLTELGHTVYAPDLPGHGNDSTKMTTLTPQSYTDSVCKLLDSLSEPVILVGHSMGGYVISEVAEARPDKIKTLVYLCAMLMQNGQNIFETANQEEPNPNNNITDVDAQGIMTLQPEFVEPLFYADCSAEDVAFAKAHLCLELASAFVTPVSISSENFGRVPRVYIETLEDKSLDPSIQKTMYTKTPVRTVFSLTTSHSPFFSAPSDLVAILNKPEIVGH